MSNRQGAKPLPNLIKKFFEAEGIKVSNTSTPSEDLLQYEERMKSIPVTAMKEKLPNAEVLEIIYKRAERFLLNKQRPLVLDAHSVHLFKLLVLYFNQDEKFNSRGENFSLKKGLLIRGVPGLGKTFSLKMFAQDFSRNDNWQGASNFILKNFVSTKRIEAEFAGAGYTSLQKYTRYNQNYSIAQVSTTLSAEEQSEDFKNCYVFDDLGTETIPVSHFSNSLNIMESILMDRYELFTDFGVKTHLTTNITDGDELESLYGQRVRSRMREMFNVIDITGTDRRK